MKRCGIWALPTLLCLAVIGWCQSSGHVQGSPQGEAPQQNGKHVVSPPRSNETNLFSPDTSTCTPANNDALPQSQKSPDPHQKPPSSLPATTAPGSTTPCVGTSGTVKAPAGTKQAEPPSGITPVKPVPNRHSNSPSPFDLTNQTNVADNIPDGAGSLQSATTS